MKGTKAHSFYTELSGQSHERRIERFNSKDARKEQSQLMDDLTSAVKFLGEESNNGKLLKKYVNNLKEAESFNRRVMHNIETVRNYEKDHKNVPLLLKAEMLYNCHRGQKYRRKLNRTNQKIRNIDNNLGTIAEVGRKYREEQTSREYGFQAKYKFSSREERKKLNEIIDKQPEQLKTNRRRH